MFTKFSKVKSSALKSFEVLVSSKTRFISSVFKIDFKLFARFFLLFINKILAIFGLRNANNNVNHNFLSRK